MIRLSINLPTEHRLHLKIVKRRRCPEDKPLLPKMGDLSRVRKGNKLSRFFRHIFEHKNIKKVLGANLVLLIFASSFLPNTTYFNTSSEESITELPLILKTETGIRYPTDQVKITQGYKFFHPGIDLDGKTGDYIYPVLKGLVEDVSYSQYAYGNAIIVNHGSNLTSLYAHLSKIYVHVGQEVAIDAPIGELGATGYALGDHLHLEIRDEGKPINPLVFLEK